MAKRIPIIYILSNGRSGSTLLDLLLGLHPEIWTMGEAQILPWEIKENRRPCGCGKLIKECEFWGPILTDIPLYEQPYPIEHFRERHNSGKVLRWSLLPDIMRHDLSSKNRDAARIYAKHNYEYFRVVWDAAKRQSGSKIRYLVDASKDPYRLYWLLQNEDLDIRIIHLHKDPRAFVYSMTKNDLGLLSRTGRFAGRWLVENLIYSYLSSDRAYAGRTLRIRYEDLAAEPNELLVRLCDWLCIDYEDVIPDLFRSAVNHAVSGNPMRWRDTKIVLDQKWQRELPGKSADLVWAMTGVLAIQYGYNRKLEPGRGDE